MHTHAVYIKSSYIWPRTVISSVLHICNEIFALVNTAWGMQSTMGYHTILHQLGLWNNVVCDVDTTLFDRSSCEIVQWTTLFWHRSLRRVTCSKHTKKTSLSDPYSLIYGPFCTLDTVFELKFTLGCHLIVQLL